MQACEEAKTSNIVKERNLELKIPKEKKTIFNTKNALQMQKKTNNKQKQLFYFKCYIWSFFIFQDFQVLLSESKIQKNLRLETTLDFSGS